MKNDSIFISSDDDSYSISMDYLYARPFQNMIESSSEEVGFCEPENDPFVDRSIFVTMGVAKLRRLNMKKARENRRACVIANRIKRQKKLSSMRIQMRKRTVDFWMDFNNGEIPSLPTLGPGKSDSIQRISVDVAKKVVEGMYNVNHLVVDCRFSYEYQGGHIINAINVSSVDELGLLLSEPRVLIFHCEFSSIRAPRLAQYLRSMDRMKNPYPLLTIPEIYVMEGGYKKFYGTYPELCHPKGYVAMNSHEYRGFNGGDHGMELS